MVRIALLSFCLLGLCRLTPSQEARKYPISTGAVAAASQAAALLTSSEYRATFAAGSSAGGGNLEKFKEIITLIPSQDNVGGFADGDFRVKALILVAAAVNGRFLTEVSKQTVNQPDLRRDAECLALLTNAAKNGSFDGWTTGLDQVSCLPIPRDAGESVVRQAVTQTIQNVAQGLASEGMTVGSPGATPSHPLSEMLDRTADVIGNAPSEFKTPFAVVRVVPIEGEYCDLVLATYGMLYSVYAERRGGSCDLLPPPNALVWGRVRHSGLATALRMANVADLASDYVDLAHYKGGKIRADSYIISTGEAIGPDWGK